MPNKVSYTISVCNESDKFGLSSMGVNDLLVADNRSSDFSLMRTSSPSEIVEMKKIHRISTLPRSTIIFANTADVDITDVSDNDTPLYLKIRRKVSAMDSILINGIEHTVFDGNFIYTNEESGTIEYFYRDRLIYSEVFESYPVFIFAGDIYLKSIFSLDNKTFSFTVTKTAEIKIKVARKMIWTRVKDEPVYNPVFYARNVVEVKPFIISPTKDPDTEMSFGYDYGRYVASVLSIRDERVRILDDRYIYLKNGKIDAETVTLKLLDSQRVEIDIGLQNILVDPELGRVDISEVIPLLPDNYFLLVDYDYFRSSNTSRYIDVTSPPVGTAKIFLYVRPTYALLNDLSVTLNPMLEFAVFDTGNNVIASSGGISLLHSDSVTEESLGEPGAAESTAGAIDVANYSTGYSIGGFGLGPFGGAFADVRHKVEEYFEMEQYMPDGLLRIAELDFTPVVVKAEILFNSRLARSQYSGIKSRSLNTYAMNILHASYDNTFSDLRAAYGSNILQLNAGIEFDGFIRNQSGNNTWIEFPISDQIGNAVYDGVSAPLDFPHVLTSGINTAAFDMASVMLDSPLNMDLDLSEFKLFQKNGNTISDLVSSIAIDIDLNILVAHFDNTGVESVGLGYRDQKPLTFIEL